MGATNFGTKIIGKFKNEKEAYNKACEEAIEYNGHREGYNGTISTTSGVKISTSSPKYGTKAFHKWEENILDKLEKYGFCIAVEIKGKEFLKLKERSFKGKKGIKAYYFFGRAAE